jgi:hypothetical protein
MSYRPKTSPHIRAVVVAVICGTALADCSDPGLYLDRRDAIGLNAGDAIAANEIAQMRDPWPAQSANTNIAYNGQRMQSAIERYRTNLVTVPVDPMVMQVANPTPGTAQTGNSQNPGSNPAAPNGAAAGAPAPPSTQ